MGDLVHRRTTVANIGYHVVWFTKRRRRVLVPELASYIETVGCISEETVARHINKQQRDGHTRRRKEGGYAKGRTQKE